jgi:Kef-type K+ transport system membrane component KefB
MVLGEKGKQGTLTMDPSRGGTLVLLGVMLLAGYVAHIAAPRISVPRVTLLLLAGAVFGPSVLDVVPQAACEWFPFVAHMALAMVGFLLGENFAGRKIQEKGRLVLSITAGEMLFAAVVVFVALMLTGAPAALALILAAIAPASAPAAIFETIREGNSKGPLTDTVLGVVAIDDGLGVIFFSLLLVVAQAVSGQAVQFSELLRGLWEVFGAVALGGLLGLPMAWTLTRIRDGQPTLIEAAGFIFLCAGLASLLNVSYLLAAMVLGAVTASRGAGNLKPFHAIEKVREPFLAVFFILAGLEFEPDKLTALGLIGVVYVAARTVGLVLGGRIAGGIAKAPAEIKSRVGWCILPQAGVALGFALLVREQLPGVGESVLALIIGTTVLFEILGPLIARRQLKMAGELQEAGRGKQGGGRR